MCGMTANRAIISGANPIPRTARGRRRPWTWSTPRAGAFARAGEVVPIRKGRKQIVQTK
jgi:hypothetical protein